MNFVKRHLEESLTHTAHRMYSSAPSNSSWLKMSAQDSHTDQESHVFKIRPMNQKRGEAITSSCSPPKSPKFSSEPPFSPTLSMQGETYLLSIPFRLKTSRILTETGLWVCLGTKISSESFLYSDWVMVRRTSGHVSEDFGREIILKIFSAD